MVRVNASNLVDRVEVFRQVSQVNVGLGDVSEGQSGALEHALEVLSVNCVDRANRSMARSLTLST